MDVEASVDTPPIYIAGILRKFAENRAGDLTITEILQYISYLERSKGELTKGDKPGIKVNGIRVIL